MTRCRTHPHLLPLGTALLGVALCLGAVPASAQGTRGATRKPAATAPAPGGGQATLLASYGDWGAYTAQAGKSKICYALSQPKARSPKSIADTPAYIFVSFRPAENVKNEIALVLNFATKDGGAGAATIGGTSFDLVTKGENGWVKNAAEEAQVTQAMGKGSSLVITALSARGNKTTDRYSLSGFAQALDRARKECP